jgi:hypothetical protein
MNRNAFEIVWLGIVRIIPRVTSPVPMIDPLTRILREKPDDNMGLSVATSSAQPP